MVIRASLYSIHVTICGHFHGNGGPNSVASIATGYGLDGPGIESR